MVSYFQIPLEIAYKLNNEEYTVNDLLINFVEEYDDDVINLNSKLYYVQFIFPCNKLHDSNKN